MPRLLVNLSLSLVLFTGFSQHKTGSPVQTVHKSYNYRLKIPSEWIGKLRHLDYKQDNTALLRQFDTFLKPGSIFKPGDDQADRALRGILNPVFADLDGESANELVCLLGPDETEPSIAVFKEIRGDWYLLYLEPFYMFYTMPELSVANNFSKNKTFYIRRLYERGSDVYSDGYSFYKLINNRVYKCLEMPHEARIYGWGLYMNQEVKMNFNINGGDADEIWFTYDYNFFPGAIKKGQAPWDGNADIPLVKDNKGINYQWDSLNHAYKPEVYAHPDTAELTAQKIACFGAFGNDKLFVHAFHAEINKTLQEGTAQQKRILKAYLSQVKQKGKATTAELEETMETGDTKFYGPKKKKAKH
ncbi:MAG TPA: hypothetical protein VHB54_20815 [Mucilaginibacter sp.]|nr:hypothetical protein [Mucilaginibacter sp.]